MPPHDPRPARTTGSLASNAVAITIALALTALGIYGGARISTAYAVTGAVCVGLLALIATASVARGHRAAGALVMCLGALGAAYCVVSGLVVESLGTLAPESEALEPLEVVDRQYLRHPTLGFLIGAPDDLFVSTPPPAALGTLTAVPLGGQSRGVWIWQDDEYGRTITVRLLHHEDEGTFLVEPTRVGLVSGFAQGMAHARLHSAETLVREQRNEIWARAVGELNGGPLACTLRALAWNDEEGGGSFAIIVTVVGHPDDDFTDYLLDVHTPIGRWRGPGIPPPGFEEAERTLASARASFTPELLPLEPSDAVLPEPPVPPPGSPFERIRFDAPIGALWAYASRVPAPAPERLPALLWLGDGSTIDTTLEEFSMAERAVSLGVVVLVPSFRGEPGNPGRPESGLGEIEDAQAALDHLRAMPGVDPARIVVAGEGIGGTRTLLLAETSTDALAFVSVGGQDETIDLVREDYPPPTYDARRVDESWVRSPVHFLSGVFAPTFAIDGAEVETPYAAAFTAAAPRGAPFSVILVPDASWEELTPSVLDAAMSSLRAGTPIAFTADDLSQRTGVLREEMLRELDEIDWADRGHAAGE